WHAHKFDPITQKDYYRLKAALEGVRHGDRTILTPAQAKEREQTLARVRQEVARLEREVADIEEVGRQKVRRSGKRAAEKDLPRPIARWSFESDARDSVGGMH